MVLLLKVYSCSELELIADLCKKHDVLCISDEVYEWLVYPPHQHIKICKPLRFMLRVCASVSMGAKSSVIHSPSPHLRWLILTIIPDVYIQSMNVLTVF